MITTPPGAPPGGAALTATVSTDEASYQPGEPVQLTLTVTNTNGVC